MALKFSTLRVCLFVVAFQVFSCFAAYAEEQTDGSAGELKSGKVAVLHLTLSGVKNETESGTFEEVILSQVEAQGRETIPAGKARVFLESDAGKQFAECLSVSCTATAGKALGAGRVISGQIQKSVDEIKISLQIIDVEAASLIAVDRGKAQLNKDLATFLKMGTERLLAQDELPPSEQELAARDARREAEDKAKKELKESRFYKGDLTTIGPMEVLPQSDRVGVVAGYRRLNFTHYVYISPEFDLHFFPDDLTKDSKLRIGFGVPLNLEIFAGEDRNEDGKMDEFSNAGQPRKEDWDSWRDGAKIIRYIQYGRKEDNLYVNVHRMFSTSIGHGSIMKRYMQNLDHFTTRVAAEFDAYTDYGGCELFTNDITWWKMTGGLLFFKPGKFFSDHWMAKSLSFGVTYMMDLDAPNWVATERTNKDGSYAYEGTDIYMVGGDVELKVVKHREDGVEHDLKTYIDYSALAKSGGGFTLGTLYRVNLFTNIRQALRFRAEFRAYQDNYTPSYFDPFYEFFKYKWISQGRTPINTKSVDYQIKTKYNEFSQRSDDWNHFGGYLELSYALLDYLGLTTALGDASGDDNADFLIHLEVPATKYFIMNATYMVTNFTSYDSIFKAPDYSMFQAIARLRPIQLLAFQFGIRKTLQASKVYFPNPESMWEIKADLDISWEF